VSPLRQIFLLLIVFSCTALADESIIGAFQGSVATKSGKDDKVLEVTISRGESEYELAGGAWYSSGRSPEPDFQGKSLPGEGATMRFTFKDSFGNEGVASISRDGSGVLLHIEISKVEESRCLPLYDSNL
jgi:hypothetical protein